MKLFEEKYGIVEYDASIPCIVLTVSGFMTSEQFRFLLNKGLEHYITKKKDHDKLLWVADTRKHAVHSDEDMRWVADDWNPRALAAGLRYMAFVLPENVFGDLTLKKYAQHTEKRNDDLVMEMFGDLQAAKAWCKEVVAQI
ncbi:hypothetical protein [Ohtaekwangia sp.]|uniref:hypothetical protein n=1 Tax=Ohtaekwangia sp. TaxID=2066019 RepID=UPI002FDE9A5D